MAVAAGVPEMVISDAVADNVAIDSGPINDAATRLMFGMAASGMSGECVPACR